MRKCFNGYNYYVLGWHDQQTNEVSLSAGLAHRYNLKGINDVSTGGIVNIKANKYFITFNLKMGFNDGIDKEGRDEDYTDEVVIHEGKDIGFGQSVFGSYATTILVGNLTYTGDNFTVAIGDDNLVIELCSIDKSNADGVLLSIGLDAVDCVSDGVVAKPRGIQTLRNGVPAMGLSGAKNEILEFIMDIPQQPQSVTCATSKGSGDVDLLVNFLSTPQVIYSPNVNTVSTIYLTAIVSEVCALASYALLQIFSVTLEAPQPNRVVPFHTEKGVLYTSLSKVMMLLVE